MQKALRNLVLAFQASASMAVMASTPTLLPLPAEDGRLQSSLPVNAATATCSVRLLGDDYQPKTKAPAAGSSADILASEDFSMLTEGTPEEPSVIIPYQGSMQTVPEGLMSLEGWRSNSFASAGGCAYLTCTNPQNPALLCTPLGDWSGSISISFKVRPLDGDWGGIDPGRARVQVAPFAYSTNLANSNIEEGFFEFTLQEKNGWAEITLNYENYTADNEGYISFGADSNVLIDDIKITTQADFLANPVVLNVTNPKEDSFTINWMPVRKAREYYIHLFSFDGFNDDGSVKLKREWPSWMGEEEIEMYESWVEDGYLTPDYLAYEQAWAPTSYTFTDLDPEKEYYFCVQAHLIHQFSADNDYYHAMFVAPPTMLEATNVDRMNGSYTANWTPVAKADSYVVNNYGVHTVATDQTDFVLLDEDFSDVPSEAQGFDDIETAPAGFSENEYFTEFTNLPGWTCKYLGMAEGMVGLYNAWNGHLTTPSIDVENGETVKVSVGIKPQYENMGILVRFAGERYLLQTEGSYYEATFEMPVLNYLESPITFSSYDGQTLFFLDYVKVTQDIPAGSQVFVVQSQSVVPADQNSLDFDNLDFNTYDNYAYLVMATHQFHEPLRDIDESCTSPYAGRQLVDNSTSDVPTLGVENIAVSEEGEAVYYDLTGRRVERPANGIFIKKVNGKATKVAL